MAPEKKPVNWRAWLVGALGALVAIVALQNSQQVRVDVLFVTVDAPLIVILLAAVAIGALIGYVTPVVRRHRRQERGQDKAG
ncbi:MAG TPA: LapA family protein [Solirubrobacterales bacterium]|nr:LapA family protein [Solirubrobacterales bacterium]